MGYNNLNRYLDDKIKFLLQTIGIKLEVILETLRVEGITYSDIKKGYEENIWPKPNIRTQCIKALKNRFENNSQSTNGSAIFLCRSGFSKPGSAIRAWKVLILLINKEYNKVK